MQHFCQDQGYLSTHVSSLIFGAPISNTMQLVSLNLLIKVSFDNNRLTRKMTTKVSLGSGKGQVKVSERSGNCHGKGLNLKSFLKKA